MAFVLSVLTSEEVRVIEPLLKLIVEREAEVVINESGNQFTDFRVETQNSTQAIFVDSSDD